MRIDFLTLFPELCYAVMNESILGRAQKAGKIEVYCHHIRDFAARKGGYIDDTIYGHGKGMLIQAEPVYRGFEKISEITGKKPHTIYMSPKGRVLTQEKALALSKLANILLICGHYEGVDQRVIDEIADEEISIGDYVLTGGELPALILADAVARLCEGVLADHSCWQEESHSIGGLLEAPHYTKPYEWRGRVVPEVLLSGHHANIERWRREQSLLITRKNRPDILEKFGLT
jgi:tRNA (guanine37-N1)-methyltransferase